MSRASIRGAAALYVLGLLAPATAFADDWPTFLGGARRGAHRPGERLDPPLNLRWSFAAGGSIESSPAVVGGTVYIGSCDGFLYALDAGTGRLKWKFQAGGVILSSPTVDREAGIVTFGCNDNHVYAVRTGDGTLAWEYATAPENPHVILHGDQVKASPAAHGGLVIVGNYAGKRLALKGADGTPVWRAKGPQVFASPATDGRRVVFASRNGVSCLEATTGKPFWNRPGPDAFLASPAIREGSVFVASAGRLSEQSRRFTSGVLPSGARLAPTPVRVLGLDFASGKTIWEVKVPDRVIASPAVTERHVIVAGVDGTVSALDRKDGRTAWTFKAGYGVWSSPVATADAVVVACTDGKLCLLRPEDGKLLWKFDTGSPFYASPAVVDGTVYAATESGHVMAFGKGPAAGPAPKPREPRDLKWAASFPVENCFWDLVGRVESYRSAPMNTWAKDAPKARYRRDRGDLIDFLFTLKVERGGGMRHDLNTGKRVTIRDGDAITVCSRPPTTYNHLHVSPTQRELPVDWTKKPRIRLVATIENPHNPLVPKGTRPFCAYLIQVQPAGDDLTPPEHWPIWHYNNWIHFTNQMEEKGHAATLGGLGLEFVGWGLVDERTYPRYYPSRWRREMKLRIYAQRTVDFYKTARNPKTGRWWSIPLHTAGVFPGEPQDESVRYTKPPACGIAADTLRGKAPLTVKFRSKAEDPDGRILWTTWDFDARDGIAVDSAERNPAHTFKEPGRYVVSLTAMDNALMPAHDHVRVTVEP